MATSRTIIELVEALAEKNISPTININIKLLPDLDMGGEVFRPSEEFKKMAGMGKANCEQPKQIEENVQWIDGLTGELLEEKTNGSDETSEEQRGS